MKVSELIALLQEYPQQSEVLINYRDPKNMYHTEWAYSELKRIDADKISVDIVHQDDHGFICGYYCSNVFMDSKFYDKGNNITETITDPMDWSTEVQAVVIDMIDTPPMPDYKGSR